MQYPVAEIFRSRQGEGFHTGRDVVFVRLAGCNLSCPFCDTDHAPRYLMGEDLILGSVRDLGGRSVILTGGEPTVHPLAPLVASLKGGGLWLGLETNGTNHVPPGFDYVTVSPKANAPLKVVQADEVRVPVDESVTLARLYSIQERVFAKNYYLSPVALEQLEHVAFDMFRFLELLGVANEKGPMLYPWRLSIQTHKLAGIQ